MGKARKGKETVEDRYAQNMHVEAKCAKEFRVVKEMRVERNDATPATQNEAAPPGPKRGSTRAKRGSKTYLLPRTVLETENNEVSVQVCRNTN